MEAKSRVTLNLVTALAGYLHRFRAVFLVVALASAGWFAVSISRSASNSAHSLLALSVLLWAVLALGTGFTLVRPPPALDAETRIGRRFKVRVLQVAYWSTVVMILLLAGLAAMMSLRAVRLA